MMTRVIKGHFDGKFVVLDEPAQLAPNKQVQVSFEEPDPQFGTVEYVMRHLTNPLPDEDAAEMLRPIEECCGRIEPEPDVNLD